WSIASASTTVRRAEPDTHQGQPHRAGKPARNSLWPPTMAMTETTRPAVRRNRHPLAALTALAIGCIVVTPIVAIAIIALSGSGEDWPHLVRNVLPGSIVTTALLLTLVTLGTASIGVVSAWLVVA